MTAKFKVGDRVKDKDGNFGNIRAISDKEIEVIYEFSNRFFPRGTSSVFHLTNAERIRDTKDSEEMAKIINKMLVGSNVPREWVKPWLDSKQIDTKEESE